MEQRIAEADERRMLNAIGKAEMIASANDSLDRSKVIADALMEEHVDKRFAKTAAAAFNKRITVNTLSRTPDSEKPAPFPISDPDMVFQLMGGEPGQLKTASVNGAPAPFAIQETTRELPRMRKAASVQKADVWTKDKFELKLSSALQKCAAAVSDSMADAISACNGFSAATKKTAEAWSSATEMEKSAAVSKYGSFLTGVLGVENGGHGRLAPMNSRLEKTAAVLKKEAAKVLCAAEDYMDCMDMASLVEDIATMHMRKTAAPAGGTPTAADAEGEVWNIGNLVGSVSGLPSGVIGEATNMATSLVNTGASTYANKMNEAEAKLEAGRALDSSPGKVLTAKFINKDRYADRLMTISDMLADKRLAALTNRTQDVVDAVNKVMDTDLSLERRDRKEVVRSAVADLLLQNNQQNMAGINALTGVAKNLSYSDKNTLSTKANELALSDVHVAPRIDRSPTAIDANYTASPLLTNALQSLEDNGKAVLKDLVNKKKETNELFHTLIKNTYGPEATVDPHGVWRDADGNVIPEERLNDLYEHATSLRIAMGASEAKENINSVHKSITSRQEAERGIDSAVNRLVLDRLYGQTPDAIAARRSGDSIELLDAGSNVVRTVSKTELDNLNSLLHGVVSDFGMDEARRAVSSMNRATAAANAQARDQQNRAERTMRERVTNILNSPSVKSKVLTDAGVPHNLNNVGDMWQWRTTPNGDYELVPRDIDAQRVLLALGLPGNIQPSVPLNLSDAQIRNLL